MQLDVDPAAECSWYDNTCGPCEPLVVTTQTSQRPGSNYSRVSRFHIAGNASVDVYQSCLRRIHWINPTVEEVYSMFEYTVYDAQGSGASNRRWDARGTGTAMWKVLQSFPRDDAACAAKCKYKRRLRMRANTHTAHMCNSFVMPIRCPLHGLRRC